MLQIMGFAKFLPLRSNVSLNVQLITTVFLRLGTFRSFSVDSAPILHLIHISYFAPDIYHSEIPIDLKLQ